MKLLFQLALLPVVALVWATMSPSPASAQALKPVAIVSVASVKENLADISYITRAAGMEDYGNTARFFASALTSGIDKERPMGVYFVPKNGEFHGIAFIPLEANGLDTILKLHKDQLGEPKDMGNGVKQVGLGRNVYLKEQSGWAFGADEQQHLTNLPPNPSELLGDLSKKYNVALKLMVQNVPEQLRRTAIDEIKLGMERFLNSPQARQGKIDRDQAEKISKASLGNLEKLFNEAEEVLIGFGIDEAAKHTVLDIAFSAKEGSSLAKQMTQQADAKTDFAGFLLPDASVTMNIVSRASKEEVEQMAPMLRAARDQWSKHIDDAPNIPAEKRDAIKAAAGQFFEVFENTLATGKIDFGGALVLLPKSMAFAAGGAVADGAAVEKALKSLVDLSKDLPDFPKVQLNSGTIGDMKLNRLTAPIPERENEARDLLGETLEIIVGISPKSVIVTGGKDAEGLLRKVLEGSSQWKSLAVPPLQINVALLPILRFYKSVDENPIVDRIVGALEAAGNDRITIRNVAAPRSSTTRIEIQEGIFKAGGEAAKAFGAARGR